MPPRSLFRLNPLFQPVTHIAVKLLEFQGTVPDMKVVPPSPNYSIEKFYHFRKRIAQPLSFRDEVDFTAERFHGL